MNQHSSDTHKREFAYGVVALETECKVIGSSDKVHVVDALAITGEEGRASLRKAPGSWQRSFDPEISEWGNPALHRWLSACEARQNHPNGKRGGVVRVMCEGSSRTEYIGARKRTR